MAKLLIRECSRGDIFVASAAPLQPLFPALVLPAREGQLEIGLDVIQTVQQTGAGRFFVMGPLGNKILHVTACGSAFDVHMAQRSSELVSKVSLKVQDDTTRIDICRGDGSIYGKILEHEQPQRALDEVSFSVVVTSSSGKAERAMLVVQGDPESFRLAAKAATDGQPVASIELQAYGEEHYLDLRLRGGKKLFYGQQGGFQHKSSKLHHDEVILAVTQQERDSFVGNSLVFYTSECQIIAFQGHDASSRTRLIAPIGSQITGLQFEGSHLTGIYLERVPLDGSPMSIARISGHVGSAVDKVVLQLRDGSTRRYGFEGGYPVGPWRLDTDEYVLLVEQDRRDAYLGNSLAFLTSKGNIIEFRGMQASRSRRFVAPPARQICGLGFTGSWLTRVTTCPLEAHENLEAGEQDLQEHLLHPD
ncbi:NEK1 [Symbiodinium pilosum]|uniref:NEK1 protein n=1 Tax=Symbiodinium pilosum TaxID=2952 RepID=A0A812IQD3_SYMPI|nr:NEK1 [Symbiodinium pilosum]